MINLYKVNGQLKARGKLLADYTEVIVANAKEQWLQDMKAEYELAYPKYIDMTEDEKTEYEVKEFMDYTNLVADYDYPKVEAVYDHTFDSWLLETEIVEPAVEEVRNEYGMVEVPYKQEVTKLLREFIAPIVTEDMLDEYLKTNTQYKQWLKLQKETKLDAITVDVNGKVFDGNDKARLNMLSAIQSAMVVDMESTYWKLADNTVAEVTVDELKEVLAKSIQAVGSIVV